MQYRKRKICERENEKQVKEYRPISSWKFSTVLFIKQIAHFINRGRVSILLPLLFSQFAPFSLYFTADFFPFAYSIFV